MTIRKAAVLGLPVLALLVAAWFVFGGLRAPAVTSGGMGDGADRAAELVDQGTAGADDRSAARAGEAGGAGRQTLVDPDAAYNAALSGFRGRLIDESNQPCGEKIVRFYRLDAEVIQNPGIFAEDDASAAPRVEVHETTTEEDGTFVVTGAWPHSFYILEADAEGDNRLTVPVDRLPGPSEIVDLGDIVLKRLGVIVGRVVDRAGRGLSGVMVRAADVPGTFLDFAPVERFDPEGALIVRAGAETKIVVEMPPFVKTYFDMLMRPRTVTLPDGRFRLGAVQPGDNVMAFNKREFVPRTRKGVKVKAGEEKSIGTVRMSEGEEAFVKVRDTNDEPVAGAEVVIAPTTVIFPLDFGFRAGQTNAKGEIYALGLPSGQITVAARRTKNHPWVVNDPITVAADVTVRLPARHVLDLTLTSEVGREILNPVFRLLPSPAEGTPLDMGAFGFIQWLDISKRVDVIDEDEGAYRIKDLNPGSYTLAVIADGHAAGRLDFKVAGDTSGALALRPESTFVVQVVDSEDRPVRRAKIYVQSPRPERGQRLMEVPVVAGQTDKDGWLVVREGEAGKVRLSASHPAYGFSHAEATLPTGDPIVLKMDAPGLLKGRLTEGGREPTPGKWTIVLEPRRRDRVRGAWPDMPKMTVPDLDGNFTARGLRPGKYRLIVVQSVQAITSPGGMIGFMMKMRTQTDSVTADVEIKPGEETFLVLDAVKEPEAIEGPAARVSGVVFVNGRPGSGLQVSGRSKRRYGVTTNAAGHFDLGLVPVGDIVLTVRDPAKADVIDMGMEGHLWRDRVSVKEGLDVVLDISVETGRISGFVQGADGAPGMALRVKATGRTGAVKEGEFPRSAAAVVSTDQKGRFEFTDLPAGVYRIEAGDRRRGSGKTPELELQPGGVLTGITVTLQKAVTVSGTVNLAALGGKPGRTVLRFKKEGGGLERTAMVRSAGTFRMRGLAPGTYEAILFVPGDSRSPQQVPIREPITVGEQDIEDVVLTPEPQKSPQPQQPGQGAGNKGGKRER